MLTFTLGLVQIAANPHNEDRLATALSLICQAAEQGAQIVVLPELFRRAYPCQRATKSHFRFAEKIPGTGTKSLSTLAKSLGVVLIAPFFEVHAPGMYYNTTVVIDADGTYLGKYRKAHLPDGRLFEEKYFFTPGDQAFSVFDTRFGQVGVLMGWDTWFPEPARLSALAGAELLVIPSSSGVVVDEIDAERARLHLDAWMTLLRGHAIANGLYVAAVNRSGREGGIHFWGHSLVVDPQGEAIANAGTKVDHVVVAACDRERIQEVRDTWPVFRDRRVDLYGDLNRRALTQVDDD